VPPARRRRPVRPGDDVLTRIALAWLVGAALVAALAGCGGSKKSAVTTAPPTARAKTAVVVYFLRDGKVQPVRRVVPASGVSGGGRAAVADAALRALVAGPSAAERELGLTTAVPRGFQWRGTTTAADGTIAIESDDELARTARAQVVYTLGRLSSTPGRPRASLSEGGPVYSTADFEDETPPILVESPLPFQAVTSPLRAHGTANTFEATFQYDLVGPDGEVLKTHFVTATSGSGTRGTFDFAVPYTVARGGTGKLVVYERSAENGRRIHVVEIPVRLTP
jgi:germination protein M